MKVRIRFEKLTDSEKMMINYLLNGTQEKIIIDNKEYTKDDIELF